MLDDKARKILFATLRAGGLDYLWQLVPGVIYCGKLVNHHYLIDWVSGNIQRLIGYPMEEVMATDWWAEHLHPDDKVIVLSNLDALLKRDTLIQCYRLCGKDGAYRWFQDEVWVLREAAGHPVQVIGCWTEITQRKRLEVELRQQTKRALQLHIEKERAQMTLHSLGEALITTDVAGLVQYINPVAEELAGWPAAEAHGQPLATVFHLIHEETREPTPDPVARCLRLGKIIRLVEHTSLLSRTGQEYAIQGSVAPIHHPGGEISGAVLIFSDVTQARRLSQAISYHAAHDALTGLINRREFERRLCRVLETSRTTDQEHALAYLDLDQFKIINDSCGHAAGDELLRQLSGLLKVQIRKRDSLARLGGDEFGVLMEHCSVRQAMRVAEALRKAAENFRFLWEDKSFRIGVSIGLVSINKISMDMDNILKAADAACYTAKQQGRNRIHIYQADDDERARGRGDRHWATRIPKALEEDRFHLSLQPIIPLQQSKSRKKFYELFLRMQDETGGIIMPQVFLSSAERYNLAARLDRWVIATALQWLVSHPSQLRQLAFCSINLSVHSLADETFPEFILEQFAANRIAPAKICFEISETTVITHLTLATRLIKVLKELGCQLALDNVGGNFSSLLYLKSLPVDFIKIDGRLVKEIETDPVSLTMVKCINEMGQLMGKKTIAEFVESKANLEKLRALGVDYAQGYFIGEPRPLE